MDSPLSVNGTLDDAFHFTWFRGPGQENIDKRLEASLEGDNSGLRGGYPARLTAALDSH